MVGRSQEEAGVITPNTPKVVAALGEELPFDACYTRDLF